MPRSIIIRPTFGPGSSEVYVDYDCDDTEQVVEIEVEPGGYLAVSVEDFSPAALHGTWSTEAGLASPSDPSIDALSFEYENPSANVSTFVYVNMVRAAGQTGSGRIRLSPTPTS